MCYHKLSVFTICGHCWTTRLPTTARCPSQYHTHTQDPPSSPSSICLTSPIQSSPDNPWADTAPSAWELEAVTSITNKDITNNTNNDNHSQHQQTESSPSQHKPEESSVSTSTDPLSSPSSSSPSASPAEQPQPLSPLNSPCPRKLTHPLHTHLIHTLCPQCHSQRRKRLARFEALAIRDGVDRESRNRKSQRLPTSRGGGRDLADAGTETGVLEGESGGSGGEVSERRRTVVSMGTVTGVGTGIGTGTRTKKGLRGLVLVERASSRTDAGQGSL